MFKAHLWYGVSIGEEAPDVVRAYIEIGSTDTVKYEVDKSSGFLKVDWPQWLSNFCPVYSTDSSRRPFRRAGAGIFAKRARRKGMVRDGDPLDICVLSEESIPHSDILLTALPISGLSLADGDEADDKIIAVMRDDAVYGDCTDIAQRPKVLTDRFRHYFLTYKSAPRTTQHKMEITRVYGREDALSVICANHADYHKRHPELSSLWPKHLSSAAFLNSSLEKS